MNINIAEILRKEDSENDSEAEQKAEQRLDEIRRISNVIQALENLVAQCEGNPEKFSIIQKWAKEMAITVTMDLRHHIHLMG